MITSSIIHYFSEVIDKVSNGTVLTKTTIVASHENPTTTTSRPVSSVQVDKTVVFINKMLVRNSVNGTVKPLPAKNITESTIPLKDLNNLSTTKVPAHVNKTVVTSVGVVNKTLVSNSVNQTVKPVPGTKTTGTTTPLKDLNNPSTTKVPFLLQICIYRRKTVVKILLCPRTF